MLDRITVSESARHSARFPAGRWADVTITTRDARVLASGDVHARGGPEAPLTEAEIEAKYMRIGFTGELSYELHCPSSLAPALWDAVMTAGKPHGLKPYGLEASRILRLEKGHILIGQDTDAITTPDELGFGWAVSKKKPFFVGKRSIEMRARLGQARKLVSLRFPADARDIPGESCLVLRGNAPVGQITSIGFSPTLGCTIALAYVHGAWEEAGGKDALERATELWQQALHDYEEPAMDPAIREELDAYVARRREEIAANPEG